MPQPGGKPDGKDRQQQLTQSFAGTAHRDVEVIPEPASQSHVPAPPEFRDTF
ncbi:hypothetical protein SDC9_209017 [bioreactor metagenome]|uniref:Uncharacterized protein n=1 Tax=bioreactor metagenome TaxID=1076179 RepID=A0A645JDM0_9ZZZZ